MFKLLYKFLFLMGFVASYWLVSALGYNIQNSILFLTLLAISYCFIVDALQTKVSNLTNPDARFSNLKAGKIHGFILSIDIRGYTDLSAKHSEDQTRTFTSRYLAMVKGVVSKYGGYVHKTNGDGHLISFGIVDQHSHRTPNENIKRCVHAFDTIVEKLDVITHETLGKQMICLGAAIDYGEIEVRVVQQTAARKELDIFGQAIIKCTRLEAHSKVIRENFPSSTSLLVISPEAGAHLDGTDELMKYHTLYKPVRDFPEISWFYIKSYNRDRDFSSTSESQTLSA